MGDLNRTILREPIAESSTYRTRLDGSAASAPIGRCTIERQGARVNVRCDTRTRAMFPELNDNDPPGAVLWRARFADQGRNGAIAKGSSGDCSIAGARGDLTHDGIDHIVISESLKKRLSPAALTMRAVELRQRCGRRAARRPRRGAALRSLPARRHLDTASRIEPMTPRERQSETARARGARSCRRRTRALRAAAGAQSRGRARVRQPRVRRRRARVHRLSPRARGRRCSATRIPPSPRRSQRNCARARRSTS